MTVDLVSDSLPPSGLSLLGQTWEPYPSPQLGHPNLHCLRVDSAVACSFHSVNSALCPLVSVPRLSFTTSVPLFFSLVHHQCPEPLCLPHLLPDYKSLQTLTLLNSFSPFLNHILHSGIFLTIQYTSIAYLFLCSRALHLEGAS